MCSSRYACSALLSARRKIRGGRRRALPPLFVESSSDSSERLGQMFRPSRSLCFFFFSFFFFFISPTRSSPTNRCRCSIFQPRTLRFRAAFEFSGASQSPRSDWAWSRKVRRSAVTIRFVLMVGLVWDVTWNFLFTMKLSFRVVL